MFESEPEILDVVKLEKKLESFLTEKGFITGENNVYSVALSLSSVDFENLMMVGGFSEKECLYIRAEMAKIS